MKYTATQVAGMVDHTNLKAFASTEDIRKLCAEAAANDFKSVCVNPVFVKFCREQLAGTGVLTCTVISFPLGQTTIAEKVNEAENAVADGCQEFDYVLNIGKLKEHDYAYIEEEMAALTAVARKTGTAVKVIFETCYLANEEIAEAAKIASRVKPDFIKTSTGFGTGGATAAHVELMHANCGPDVCVKASGGIRSWAEAKAMLDAGASRLGVSAGMKIISELKEQEG